MTVAKTILQQLGSGRFEVMVNASSIVYEPDRLTFRIMRNSKAVSAVSVILQPNDTYTMQFIRIRIRTVSVLNEVDGLYADQLQEVFTRYTGLLTHL